MSDRIRVGILCFLLIAGSCLVPGTLEADYYDGLRAYESNDHESAFKEWLAAANTGHAKSQFRLGRSYEAGEGVPQNVIEAYRWYRIAAAQGHAEAKAAATLLAGKLSETERAGARKRAAEWRPMEASRQAADFPSAIAGGDLERVKELLSGGSDPNQKLSNGDSVLLLAAAVGNTGIVRSLLEAGANVDHAGEAGWTPLMVAIFSKYRELTSLLIENGADRKFTASDGVTPMALALQSGDDELIALLAPKAARTTTIEAPAELEIFGMTLVTITDKVRREFDLDASARGSDSKSAVNDKVTGLLVIATKGGGVAVLSRIRPGDVIIKVGTELVRSTTEMLRALDEAVSDKRQSVLLLVKRGQHDPSFHFVGLSGTQLASVLRSSRKSRTGALTAEQMKSILPCKFPGRKAPVDMLGISCFAGGGEVVTERATTSPGDDAGAATGSLSLLIASASGNLPKVRSLLAAGAKVNGSDTDGWTALIHATNNGHKEVVSELLKAGANVNAKSKNGTTALVVATLTEMEGIAKDLIRSDASPYMATASGVSALDVARAKDKKNLVTLFLSKLPAACKSGGRGDGTKVRDARLGVWIKCPPLPTSADMLRAASAGRAALVRELEDKGVSANAADSDGWSALMFAAAKGHSVVVNLLLVLGAEVNHRSNDGTTPLMVAVSNNKMEAVRSLLRKDANRYLKNKKNLTAFIIADKKKLRGMLRVLGPRIPSSCGKLKRETFENGVTIDCPETSSWTSVSCTIYANPYISRFKTKSGRVTKRKTVYRPYISVQVRPKPGFRTGTGEALKVVKKSLKLKYDGNSYFSLTWNTDNKYSKDTYITNKQSTKSVIKHLRKDSWIELKAIFADGGTALFRYNLKGFTAAHNKVLRDCNSKWP